jgi:hypothetical protein
MATPRRPRLLDQVRERCRVKHHSLRTEQAYVHWIRRLIHFHGNRHPREMGGPEVDAFLSHLAVQEDIAPSTQNQPLATVHFLYREVREGKGAKDRRTMLPACGTNRCGFSGSAPLRSTRIRRLRKACGFAPVRRVVSCL